MLQNTDTDYKHQLFIEKIVDSGVVWGLSSHKGWAISPSNDYEDTDVLPFWSDKVSAKALAKEDWDHHAPQVIDLAEYLEDWLVGMHNDATMAGTNWDVNLCGRETEPLDLALQIVAQLREKHKVVRFKKYGSLNDYEESVRKELE